MRGRVGELCLPWGFGFESTLNWNGNSVTMQEDGTLFKDFVYLQESEKKNYEIVFEIRGQLK